MRRVRMMAGMAILALGIAAVLVATSATAAEGADRPVPEIIEAAKTAKDHKGLAKFYDEQAKDAQVKAAEYKKMRDAYRKAGESAAKADLPTLCDGLAKIATSAADKYSAMANAHREIAKQLEAEEEAEGK